MNTDKIYAETVANEYAPKSASKVVALKKLDRKAKSKANIFGYTFGVIMSLVLGVGMCLSMKVIGDGSDLMMIAGIAVGIIGIAGVSINYPVYKKLLEIGKKSMRLRLLSLQKKSAKSPIK